MDPVRTPDPEAIVRGLPRGWGVIYRHFGAPERERVARRLAELCRKRKLVFLVSGDLELARRVKADGVHWPERMAIARGSRPRQWIETAAAHSRRGIARAARLGMDAAIVSTVFASRSPTATKPMGSVRFHALARRPPLPLYALGGVNSETAGRILAPANARIAGWAAVEGLKVLAKMRGA